MSRAPRPEPQKTTLLGMEVSPAVVELLAERAAKLDIHLQEKWIAVEREDESQHATSEFRLGMQRGYAVALAELHDRTVAEIERQLRERIRRGTKA